jgi:Flp pilus assembly protein TadG
MKSPTIFRRLRVPRLTGFRRHSRGAVLVEMAIALPVLLTLIMGIISYGEWFLTAHSIQQTANDAARSAISGLTATERQTTAIATAQTDMRRGGVLNPARATFSVNDDNTTVVVAVQYDASNDPLLHLSFVPMPANVIRRTAVIRLDGL